MDFLDVEINYKLYVKILVILSVLLIMLIALYYSSLLVFKSYTLGEGTIISDERINTHIDLLECEGKKLEIAGWAYKEQEEIKTINSNYVIINRDTGKMYLMRTKSENNINLKDTEYEMAGLHSQCLLLGLPSGTYDIYVLFKNNDCNQLVNTKIYFNV